jgi:hypothetical protein
MVGKKSSAFCFINDKVKMRDRVVNKKDCESLVPLDMQNKE